jgi:hypothetical protein
MVLSVDVVLDHAQMDPETVEADLERACNLV